MVSLFWLKPGWYRTWYQEWPLETNPQSILGFVWYSLDHIPKLLIKDEGGIKVFSEIKDLQTVIFQALKKPTPWFTLSKQGRKPWREKTWAPRDRGSSTSKGSRKGEDNGREKSWDDSYATEQSGQPRLEHPVIREESDEEPLICLSMLRGVSWFCEKDWDRLGEEHLEN